MLQTLEQFLVTVEDVSPGIQTFHGVNDQVEMVELRSHRIEKVCRYAASGAVQHGGKLRQCDRRAGKLAGRTTSQDDLLDRVTRHLSVAQSFELNHWSLGRQKAGERSAAAPGRNFRRRMQRRSSVHFAHERIVNLLAGEWDGCESQRGECRRRWGRQGGTVAERHQGKRYLPPGIDIEQRVHGVVHKTTDYPGG